MRGRCKAGVVGALLLVSVLAGPAAQSQEAPSQEAPSQDARIVRVAIKGYENNLTPFTISFGALPATNDLVELVYDSLFWSQAKADPEPWLAESAESSEDGRVWTVKLRGGVKWSDGAPFTADDVKFSFEYYLAQFSGRYAHHVADVPAVFERGEVIDPLTVRLSFATPSPQFKIMPGGDLPIIPKHVWELVTEPNTATAALPVGTGPFRVVEMVSDQRYRLEANPNYFKGRPTVDGLDLVVIKDPASAFAALRTGDVDMVERTIPPELVEQFKGNSDIKVAESTRFESEQLYFNARKAPLSDPKLRKAISMAIDVNALVGTVVLGNARPGRDSFLHPDSPWAIPDGIHDLDPEGARRMLDEAGYGATDPDGVRKAPDGSRLDFSALLSSFEPLEIRAMQMIAQQVEQIGVRIRPEPLEPTALRARRQAASGQPPSYDLYVSNLEAHAQVDPDALYYVFHSPNQRSGGSIGGTGYSNATLDGLVEQATTAATPQRKELLARAQGILADETPVIAMWYPDGLYAYRPAAYDGWVRDPGQGILTKRSFLAEYVNQASASRDQEAPDTTSSSTDAGSGGLVLAVVGVLAVAAIAGVVVSRRRSAAAVDDE